MKSDENPAQYPRHEIDLAEELFANAEIRSIAGRLRLADDEYKELFWRPYLGAIPFSFYKILCWLDWHEEKKGRWPSITILAQMMGKGADRYTILGRPGYEDRPELEGALDVLVREHLVAYDTTGEGTATRYNFAPRKELPLLTPSQVQRAGSSPFRKTHLLWLEHRNVDIDGWKRIKAPSLIPLL